MNTTQMSEANTMTQSAKLLYTAKAHTTGGREGGASPTSDGLPGLERQVAQSILDGAEQTCPYSKATRGNIDVAINLV